MQSKLHPSVFESKSNNVYYNLALEEYFLMNLKDDEMILYLWQNDNTIVIGKNQNPWKECNIDKIQRDDVKIARRLSGGGAVFHDMGNLNFTFIVGKKNFDINRGINVIINGVKKSGIDSEFTGRNDILSGGRKFSGNAFYFNVNNAYQHGTILVSANTKKMDEYLNVSKQKIESKGIDSVKSRVINLCEIKPSITIEEIKENIKQSFENEYGKYEEYDLERELNEVAFENLKSKYESYEWTYGQTPNFNIKFEDKFPWGEVQIHLNVVNGTILSSKIYSDSMDVSLIKDIETNMFGIKYNLNEIEHALHDIKNPDEEIIHDIKNILKQNVQF